MLKQHISATIASALSQLDIKDQEIHVDHPTNQEFGDYTSNIAMRLAKELKRNPLQIAEEIIQHIQPDEVIAKVEVMKPGFINVWVKTSFLLKKTSEYAQQEINLQEEKYQNKKIIIEYSSPNIAKPFTIGHLRSTIIGDAMANLYEAIGYTVYRDNHLGDWGTQFGKQIYAIKEWGNEAEIESAQRPVKKLVELYVKFHEESEKNPDIEEEARKWFKELEEGDAEARRLWQKCIDWSFVEFDAIYKKLGVTFSPEMNNGRGYGESYFEDKMEPVIQELKKHNLLKESKGAQVVFFPEDKYPPLMIIKQDGATLYGTRDLATDKFRLDSYGKDITIVNEVGIEQSLYFNQLYEIEKLLGWYKEGQRVHLKHGHYRFKDTKMSTRKGNVIWLEDVLKTAEEKAFILMSTSGSLRPGLWDAENEYAERINQINKQENYPDILNVAIGALKWNDLKRNSQQDIVFDWDDILNMQGNSGPYMQYAYARCKSILGKSDVIPDFDSKSMKSLSEENIEFSQEELQIMRTLITFPEIVQSSAEQFSPNILCNYLFELAQQYNLFYQKHPILKAETDIKKFRLILTTAVASVLQKGLHLLGIQTIEKM